MAHVPTLLVTALLLVGCGDGNQGHDQAAAATPHATVFVQQPYERALDLATKHDKLLLVDFTAVWCAPCKEMEKTTWVDPTVVEWIEQHGVAVQVDADRRRELAQQFGIQGLPTVVAMREGEEVDRVVGYRRAEELLTWLENVLVGRTALDSIREAAGERPEPGERADMRARLTLAESLVDRRRYDEATDEFVWLWNHMVSHEPAMAGVRVSFMAGDMEQLARTHDPAREAFAELRDALTPAVRSGEANQRELLDWVVLNEVVGEQGITLEWFQAMRDEPNARERLGGVDLHLYRLLVERGQWADAGWIYADPAAEAERHIGLWQMTRSRGSEPPDARIDEMRRELLKQQLSELYAACLAADRDDEAIQVAEAARAEKELGGTSAALIRAALAIDEPREHQLQWIGDETETQLNDRLRAALDTG
jgi:thiol-disulfide isomerase/thioredoxin